METETTGKRDRKWKKNEEAKGKTKERGKRRFE